MDQGGGLGAGLCRAPHHEAAAFKAPRDVVLSVEGDRPTGASYLAFREVGGGDHHRPDHQGLWEFQGKHFHTRWHAPSMVWQLGTFGIAGFNQVDDPLRLTPFMSLVRMLPKPTGGWRPIALLAAILRLYSKIRLQQVTAWAQANPFRSQVMVTARTASDSVWRTQLRAGVARSESRSAIELAWDLQKAFDNVPYATLIDIAKEEEYQLVLILIGKICGG